MRSLLTGLIRLAEEVRFILIFLIFPAVLIYLVLGVSQD